MPDLKSVNIRPMTAEDIDQVMVVEYSAFDVPWSRQAFENEITGNHFASYFVAELDGRIIGYCGVWVIVDEAHITNLAVLEGYRGFKVGESLLRQVMLHAVSQQARSMSLEVRVSNKIAQNLYRKLGFKNGGIRKNYYSNNGEDALVMWVRL
ncbi:ribosomal protein S18-alanine N-acetyltransferase [Sporolactobacillus shoreicorticis]|uniref:[Ribosomal protein bS18]-alanine N-acetyltransferase n=1 Tax=Sporolactobacillus shoreicorticis TaxID=1923877 RepID=A0ABW5RZT0_9BACL|nr:ribosomal protein S18-alanine N-acetyltransferase [Sporolactobacillus shoreicorticis]MCO7128009.1 ribosomal protein S18-alanine N-acetyltransferase [Sporolactobacillus shoreicorticis]